MLEFARWGQDHHVLHSKKVVGQKGLRHMWGVNHVDGQWATIYDSFRLHREDSKAFIIKLGSVMGEKHC